MVKKAQFRAAIELAVTHVDARGDTDIFPFPLERHAFHDCRNELVDLVEEYNEEFDSYLEKYPPDHVSGLVPAGYTGFRWATQLDPIWNIHFLACVLALRSKIEEARIPPSDRTVFSYRIRADKKTGELYDQRFGWYQFMEESLVRSRDYRYVVTCDISEFYPRLGHHRIENALLQIAGDTSYPRRIARFLSKFSGTRSFGLPIGGSAARILSELTINQIDRLLVSSGIEFTRFADDYHLFAQTDEEAYRALILLSEKLFENQGLSLQKSKTRILTSTEFQTTHPLNQDGDEASSADSPSEDRQKSRLLRFSLKFDPYSPTREEDYERLRSELQKFDVIGLLKSELNKSRIHAALTRKIVGTIRYLSDDVKNEAIVSILSNSDLLYPIFSSVLMMLNQCYDTLSPACREVVQRELRSLIQSDSHVMRVDCHLAFAVRVLAHEDTPENHILLQRLYERRTSPLVRRDIIVVLARWGDWYWLSDLRNRYRHLSGFERRTFIAASYRLSDEGRHWRDHTESEMNPFEKFILRWAGQKANRQSWRVPL